MEVFNLYRDLIHVLHWYVLYIDKSTERWVYKSLRKVYTDDELIKLYNIKKNEFLNKIKDLADCD